MPQILKPNFSNALWASGGAIVAPSNVKIATGWTAEVPPFQWENYSQNRQDQGIAHILQHGISVWDSLTEYQAGKSLVQGSDGLTYKALQTSTNQNPVTDTTFVYWSKALSGGLLNVRTITTTQTYVPTPGTTSVLIELVGGGGAGGGTQATGNGQGAVSTGGAGGGYSRKRLTSGFSGQILTIGAGGIPVTGGSGGNGQATTFGSIFSAQGGTGGSSQIASVFPAFAGTNPPGFGLNGDFNGTGHWAENSLIFGPTSLFQSVGASGGSHYGGGVRTTTDTGPVAGTLGGGGSGVGRSQNLGALPGGVGGAGIAIIWEYL